MANRQVLQVLWLHIPGPGCAFLLIVCDGPSLRVPHLIPTLMLTWGLGALRNGDQVLVHVNAFHLVMADRQAIKVLRLLPGGGGAVEVILTPCP